MSTPGTAYSDDVMCILGTSCRKAELKNIDPACYDQIKLICTNEIKRENKRIIRRETVTKKKQKQIRLRRDKNKTIFF